MIWKTEPTNQIEAKLESQECLLNTYILYSEEQIVIWSVNNSWAQGVHNLNTF